MIEQTRTIPTLADRTMQYRWIDLMEKSLERRTAQPAPVAVPVAPAEPTPAPKPQPAPPPQAKPAPKPQPVVKALPVKPQPTSCEEEQPAMKLLRYLDAYERERGQMPSYLEIATQHLQSNNPGLAHYCVRALEQAGLVVKEPHKTRGLRITKYGRQVLEESAEEAREAMVS